MQHIPQTTWHDYSIDIPYVVSDSVPKYPGPGSTTDVFFRFRDSLGLDEPTLKRHGWENEQFTSLSFTQGTAKSKQDVESSLQEWLVFGLLSEILAKHFKREDFLRIYGPHKQLITTERLPALLREYQVRWDIPHSEERQRQQIVRLCMAEATRFYNTFFGSGSRYKGLCPCRDGVILSIGSMVSTLAAAVGETWKVPNMPVTWPQVIDDLLRKNNWCPTSINMLERMNFGVGGMYYAAMLGPRVAKLNHKDCSASSMYCLALQLDPNDPPTTHSKDCLQKNSEGASCRKVPVEISKVVSIISSGQSHPLITVSTDSNVSVKVQESDPKTSWVAISHVWADGLGSKKNDLNECQLRHLQKQVNSLYDTTESNPTPFWIDTLCIPKWPIESRRAAINNLVAIYRDASSILVLDAELYTKASRRASYTEILMRIISSNWMRRLWTLQEAVLGKKLFFLFSDGVLDMAPAMESMYRHLKEGIENHQTLSDSQLLELYPGQHISRVCLDIYTSIRRSDRIPAAATAAAATTTITSTPARDRLATTWNTMMWRSTSHVSDETICLATLLELPPTDMATLQSVGSKESSETDKAKARYLKFMEILTRQSEWVKVPRGLVFMRGKKLKENGLGWAPESFFRTAKLSTLIDPNPMGTITPIGLEFMAGGYEIHLAPTRSKSRLLMLDEESKAFYDVDFDSPVLENEKKWEEIAPEEIEDPAIILPSLLTRLGASAVGLLVRINRRESHTFFAEILGHIYVRHLPPSLMSWEKLTETKGPKLAKEMEAGLMEHLWNRRSSAAPSRPHRYVDTTGRLDKMARKWHKDGTALNDELDHRFASGRAIRQEQAWCIS